MQWPSSWVLWISNKEWNTLCYVSKVLDCELPWILATFLDSSLGVLPRSRLWRIYHTPSESAAWPGAPGHLSISTSEQLDRITYTLLGLEKHKLKSLQLSVVLCGPSGCPILIPPISNFLNCICLSKSLVSSPPSFCTEGKAGTWKLNSFHFLLSHLHLFAPTPNHTTVPVTCSFFYPWLILLPELLALETWLYHHHLSSFSISRIFLFRTLTIFKSEREKKKKRGRKEREGGRKGEESRVGRKGKGRENNFLKTTTPLIFTKSLSSWHRQNTHQSMMSTCVSISSPTTLSATQCHPNSASTTALDLTEVYLCHRVCGASHLPGIWWKCHKCQHRNKTFLANLPLIGKPSGHFPVFPSIDFSPPAVLPRTSSPTLASKSFLSPEVSATSDSLSDSFSAPFSGSYLPMPFIFISWLCTLAGDFINSYKSNYHLYDHKYNMVQWWLNSLYLHPRTLLF